MIHKKCHKLIKVGCNDVEPELEQELESSNGLETSNGLESSNGHVRNSKSQDNAGASGEDKENNTRDGTTFNEMLINETSKNSNAISLEDFDPIKVIGRGSYAKILLVELKKTKQIYAMKVIKKELFVEDDDTGTKRVLSARGRL